MYCVDHCFLQEDKFKPLELIYLYHKCQKKLTSYLALLSQSVNWGGCKVNNYVNLILLVLFYS